MDSTQATLAALVDVEGECCCGSLVAAGEGSCDSLIVDQSRTTGRQQQAAGPAGDVREMRFLLVLVHIIHNTYVRTSLTQNTYASKRYKMYSRYIVKATIVMLYPIIYTTYRIAVSHISPYMGRYISYII